jgi:subtilisin-like proprotein convertase family protein
MARWWLLIVCPLAAALGATLLLAVMAGSGMAAQEVESIVLCRAPAMPIPDGLPAGVTDTLVVSSDLTLVTAEIAVTITQGWVGDLVLVLTRGEGEPAVTLLERAGVSASSPYGCGASLLAAQFTDAATGGVGACTSEITGTVRPALPLALLAGRPLSGSWQLRVIDAAAGKAATLDSWCLHAQASAAPRLAITPDAASHWVAPGLTGTMSVTLENRGSATWEWGGEPAAAGGELLFVEAFEGSGMPPAGWELQPQLVTATWGLQQDVSHSGAQAPRFRGAIPRKTSG